MAQKRKKNKKVVWWIIVIILFVVAGVVVYFVWDGYFKDKGGNKKDEGYGSVEEVIVVDDGGKKETESKQDEEVVEKEPVVQYEGEDPNEEENLTGVMTYAGVSGDYLLIRVNIDQYLDSGSCELNLVQGGVVYSGIAGVVSSASTATCEGFNVPVGNLSAGNYQIVIKIDSNGKTGVIEGEVKL